MEKWGFVFTIVGYETHDFISRERVYLLVKLTGVFTIVSYETHGFISYGNVYLFVKLICFE